MSTFRTTEVTRKTLRRVMEESTVRDHKIARTMGHRTLFSALEITYLHESAYAVVQGTEIIALVHVRDDNVVMAHVTESGRSDPERLKRAAAYVGSLLPKRPLIAYVPEGHKPTRKLISYAGFTYPAGSFNFCDVDHARILKL